MENNARTHRLKQKNTEELHELLKGRMGRYAVGLGTKDGLLADVRPVRGVPKGANAAIYMHDIDVNPVARVLRQIRKDLSKSYDQLNHLNVDGKGVVVLDSRTSDIWTENEIAKMIARVIRDRLYDYDCIHSIQILSNERTKRKKKRPNFMPVLKEVWRRPRMPRLPWLSDKALRSGVKFMAVMQTPSVKRKWSPVGRIEKGYFMHKNQRLGPAFPAVENLKNYQRRVHGRRI